MRVDLSHRKREDSTPATSQVNEQRATDDGTQLASNCDLLPGAVLLVSMQPGMLTSARLRVLLLDDSRSLLHRILVNRIIRAAPGAVALVHYAPGDFDAF